MASADNGNQRTELFENLGAVIDGDQDEARRQVPLQKRRDEFIQRSARRRGEAPVPLV
jgi:hypothetical protein